LHHVAVRFNCTLLAGTGSRSQTWSW